MQLQAGLNANGCKLQLILNQGGLVNQKKSDNLRVRGRTYTEAGNVLDSVRKVLDSVRKVLDFDRKVKQAAVQRRARARNTGTTIMIVK
jgi:hypothetical protein